MSDKSIVDNPELVIGLVGPIGVDLESVIEQIQIALKSVGYSEHVIHITSLMQDFLPHLTVKSDTYGNRYNSLISNADLVRKKVNDQAALACLAISEIRRIRGEINIQKDKTKKIEDAQNEPALQNAYIIRQFKREEEVNLLREVYGRKFIQVSIYSDVEDRKNRLIKKIKSFGTQHIEDSDAEKEAIDLINRDHNEIQDDFGQRISDVFHLGDVFVSGESKKSSNATITRFINAFFGHNGISPTKIEYGMYAAAGAALRSLDLSRQIGAAVFSDRGEIITFGCNEVPKAFGGTYWSDDPGEQFRDFEEGEDRNHIQKLQLLHDLIDRLGNLGFLSESLKKEDSTAERVKKVLSDKQISDSKLMDIIEFGRIIHAEMSAITDAARKGKALLNSILFSTTFPCHMCAKHIVSSGIKRVVFLEPYPKSHAKELHKDSITFLPSEKDTKVLFEPFIGISPRRYRDIFEKKKRKDKNGKAVIWANGKPTPRVEDRSSAYIANEQPAITFVVKDILAFSDNQK